MRVSRLSWDGREPERLAKRLRAVVPDPEELIDVVRPIIAEVGERGDAALNELSAKLDGSEPAALPLPVDRVAAARDEIDPGLRQALERAAANIRALAEAELAADRDVDATLPEGQRLSVVSSPIRSAGVYAPGGGTAYPSSVLMGAIPARVAGVGRVAVCSPPAQDGAPAPALLAACAIAGVDEVYPLGGAQAIAALALGTESVPAVDLVAGPGNRYVVEAKRLLSGRVGVDGIAGPTELVVLADERAPARALALDLCAQAEHGADGLLVAVSTGAALLDELEAALPELSSSRPSVAEAPVALVEAPTQEAALELADAIAPEHLELQLEGADERLAAARVAGCVFVGDAGATAFGDYAAGSNHVLPTGGAARYGSPLGVATYMRRTSVVSIPHRAADALAPTVATLARSEGFPVHGESAQARARENGGPR